MSVAPVPDDQRHSNSRFLLNDGVILDCKPTDEGFDMELLLAGETSSLVQLIKKDPIFTGLEDFESEDRAEFDKRLEAFANEAATALQSGLGAAAEAIKEHRQKAQEEAGDLRPHTDPAFGRHPKEHAGFLKDMRDRGRLRFGLGRSSAVVFVSAS